MNIKTINELCYLSWLNASPAFDPVHPRQAEKLGETDAKKAIRLLKRKDAHEAAKIIQSTNILKRSLWT